MILNTILNKVRNKIEKLEKFMFSCIVLAEGFKTAEEKLRSRFQ